MVDGLFTNQASGTGLILITPNKMELEYAVRFGFKAMNNEAEYKALVIRLKLSRDLGAKQIIVNSDSQLVVESVLG